MGARVPVSNRGMWVYEQFSLDCEEDPPSVLFAPRIAGFSDVFVPQVEDWE